MSAPSFASSIPSKPRSLSPGIVYPPVFSSPYPPAVPQSTSPALSTPVDWTWSGLGLATPAHLQFKPKQSSWSIAAAKGGNTPCDPRPAETSVISPPDADTLSPAMNRKRGYVEDPPAPNVTHDDCTKDIK